MSADERLIAGETASPNEENIDRALRPTMLADYVGQRAVREQLHIFIEAAKRRGDPTICSCSVLPASGRRRSRTSSLMKWA